MKTLYILFAMLLMSIGHGAMAQDLFRRLSWDEAKAEAARQDKGIFVDAYTSWCGPCKRMAREVFTDAAVVQQLQQQYVCLQLDAEKEASHGFFSLYKPQAYPSLYWLSADGSLRDSHEGFLSAGEFIAATQQAAHSNAAQELALCRKQWDDGKRDAAFVSHYLFEVLPQTSSAQVRPLLCQYLDGLTPQEKASTDVCDMVSRFSRSIEDDAVFRTLAENCEAYRQAKASADFDRQLYTIMVRVPLADRQLGKDFERDLHILRSINFPSRQLFLDAIAVEQQLFDGQYQEGLTAALALCEQHAAQYPVLAAELSYTLIISRFFQKETDQPTRQLALQLAEQARRQTPTQATLSYEAACQAALGNTQRAYELMMHAPFFPAPALSNAIFPLLGLKVKEP